MNKRIVCLISLLLLVGLAGTFLAACGSSSIPTPIPSPKSTVSGSSLDGQALMEQRCSACHSINRVTSAQHTAAQWQITVNRMIGHGAKLTPQEEQVLVNYLAQNY